MKEKEVLEQAIAKMKEDIENTKMVIFALECRLKVIDIGELTNESK